MRFPQAFYKRLESIKECDVPIAECAVCKSEFFYLDRVHKVDDELYCDDCFADWCKGFEIELDEDFIEWPDEEDE